MNVFLSIYLLFSKSIWEYNRYMTLLELFYNFSRENPYLSKKTLQKMSIFLKLNCYMFLDKSTSSISNKDIKTVLSNIENNIKRKKMKAYLNIIFKYSKD